MARRTMVCRMFGTVVLLSGRK
uniref:Uncharacterized protein n=1 Tax=Anopheles funestus TaxID=62324 RepID=A0A182S3Q3_ANOFN